MNAPRLPLRVSAATLAALLATGTAALPPAQPLSGGVGAGVALAAVPARDAVRTEQWHLRTLDVATAWTYAKGAGVTVAVIDSGVDARHPDLAGQVLPGLDLVDPKGDAETDPVGHGTTVSALIAGRDDADGVVGIAPKARILPIRVLDRQNRYNDALVVAKAVRWAVDHGARVINLSLGGSGSSAALAAAIDYAFARDVVVVACTGNASASASGGVWYPAREPGVLAVAGLERDGDVLWNGSITGRETVVAAPATHLYGARPPTGYWRVQGTSFAAPMVSATAALIRSHFPAMSAADVINRIVRTADDRGPAGRDATYGFGMIDPVRALTAQVPPVTGNPLDTTPAPGVARVGDAPAAGEAQSAPDDTRPGTSTRVSGANAGAAVPGSEVSSGPGRGWWAAGAFLLLSVLVGLVTIRRYTRIV